MCGPFVARAGGLLAPPARVSHDSLGELQEARGQAEGVPARYPTRLHLVPEREPQAQRVATLLSLTLLSARVSGPDSIQVIAPPSASHAAQMAISPTLRTPRVPPSPAAVHSADW